jgi:hypothetical protein
MRALGHVIKIFQTGTNFEMRAMEHTVKIFQTGSNFETTAMGHIVKIFQKGSNSEMRAQGHIGHGDRVSLLTALKKGKQIENQIRIHVIIRTNLSSDVHQQPTKQHALVNLRENQ